MADADYFEEYETPADRQSIGAVFSFAGAVLSLGLIGGLAWWGYDLTVRDVSGIPVVQALEGPMRTLPDDPGGQQAQHQGLSVNNVQADGQARPAADRLILAPPPISITSGDTPVTEASYTPRATETTSPAVDPATQIANEVAQGVALQVEADQTQLDVIPADVPGVARSPRPTPRPDMPVVQASASTDTPSELPAGTSLVQLGAFQSQADALAGWEIVTARHSDFFFGKQRFIQQVDREGDTIYRLRATGFADLNDARRFCAALEAEGTDCIPAAIR